MEDIFGLIDVVKELGEINIDMLNTAIEDEMKMLTEYVGWRWDKGS